MKTFTTQSVGLIVAAALAVGWFSASLTQPAAPAQSSAASGSGIRPLGSSSVVVPKAERLKERMPSAPLPARGRNPFVYAPRLTVRPSAGYAGRAEAPVEAAAAPVAPIVPAGPVFRLSGIASNAENGVTTLTAIINDNGSLVFAKAGDKLSNGYSVVRVEEMSVTLVDASGVTQTIRLP